MPVMPSNRHCIPVLPLKSVISFSIELEEQCDHAGNYNSRFIMCGLYFSSIVVVIYDRSSKIEVVSGSVRPLNRGGSDGRVSDLRSKDRRLEPRLRQEHKKNV